MKLKLYGEVCCELCYSVIHNHMYECPVCHTKEAGTTLYLELAEYDWNEPFSCESCNTTFVRTNEQQTWYWADIEVEVVE